MRRQASKWIGIVRIFFAILGIVALVAQLMQSIGASRSTVDFFSYFTIQSNMIAVAVLLWVAVRPAHDDNMMLRDIVRGASVLYLAVTGIVFAALLSDLPLVTVAFANTVLHKIMPIVVALDWIIDPPINTVTFRRAMVWMVYPLIWLTYTIVRGYIIGWYPYPFLDPQKMGGYTNVMGTIVAILAGALILIWALIWIGRLATKIKPT